MASTFLGNVAEWALQAGLHVIEQRVKTMTETTPPPPRPNSIETRRDERGVYVPVLET